MLVFNSSSGHSHVLVETSGLQSLQLDPALKHRPCSWIGPLNPSEACVPNRTTKLLPIPGLSVPSDPRLSISGHCISVTWVIGKPVQGHSVFGHCSMQGCSWVPGFEKEAPLLCQSFCVWCFFWTPLEEESLSGESLAGSLHLGVCGVGVESL